MAKNAYVGIDLGGTTIQFGLVDESHKIVHSFGQPTPRGRAEILEAMAAAVAKLGPIAKTKGLRPVAVGVGSAGIVDLVDGKIIGRSPNIPGWEGTKVKYELEARTALPTTVDNDANVMALAEHMVGAGQGYSSGLYVTVGTGIGSGIVLNNELWRGSSYAGAEFGHTILVPNGRACPCGKKGCLERYAATAAFRRYFGEKLPKEAGIKGIFDLAEQGNRKAAEAIHKAADHLACGIGSVLELLNPEVVVIGGGIAAGKGYLAEIREALPKYSTRTALHSVKLKRAKLGNRAGMLGAALLCTAK